MLECCYMKREIILASVSPRREQVFRLLNIKFKVADSGFKEIVDPKLSHQDLVKFLALGKARAAAKKYPNAIIVAADTMVSFGGKIIGKPKNKELSAFSLQVLTKVLAVI